MDKRSSCITAARWPSGYVECAEATISLATVHKYTAKAIIIIKYNIVQVEKKIHMMSMKRI